MRTRNRSAAELGVPRTAWTVAEAAASLGIDYDACLIHAGKLKHFKIGARYRVPAAALEQYIEHACEAAERDRPAS